MALTSVDSKAGGTFVKCLWWDLEKSKSCLKQGQGLSGPAIPPYTSVRRVPFSSPGEITRQRPPTFKSMQTRLQEQRLYSPIKSANDSSFPELSGSEHVKNPIVCPGLVPTFNLFLFKLLYGMFELRGVDIHPISLGVLHEQLVSLVQTIFGNQPSRGLWNKPWK